MLLKELCPITRQIKNKCWLEMLAKGLLRHFVSSCSNQARGQTQLLTISSVSLGESKFASFIIEVQK